jgi:hypothetical protein
MGDLESTRACPADAMPIVTVAMKSTILSRKPTWIARIG